MFWIDTIRRWIRSAQGKPINSRIDIGLGGTKTTAGPFPTMASRSPSSRRRSPSCWSPARSARTSPTSASSEASTRDGFELSQVNLVARGLLDSVTQNATLNLKIGRILPDVLPVLPGLNRGFGEGFASTLSVGNDGFTYGGSGDGIELWGTIAGRLKWVAGVVNGIKPVNDTTTRRDFFGRLQVKIGGERYDYRGAHPDSKSSTNFQIGAAGYWGATVVDVPAMGTDPAVRQVNRIERLSGDLRLRSHGLDLIGMVILGRDSNPDGDSSQVDSLIWSGEIDWAPVPWLQPFARYDEARFEEAHPESPAATRSAAASPGAWRSSPAPTCACSSRGSTGSATVSRASARRSSSLR